MLNRWGREIGEPLSWILGILVSIISIIKIYNLFNIKVYFSGGFLGIIIGFVLHELAHRNTARRYGLSTEFIAYTPGLILTFLSGFIPGIILLVPGYVKTTVYRYVPKLEKALFYSVAAGPATNIGLSAATRLLASIVGGHSLHAFLVDFSTINAWMAFFNLLPVPPLDGSKIISLNKPIWAVMIVASLLLFVF